VIVRTLLAVAVAVALVGMSQSAIESAARERTATLVGEEVDRFVDRARSLVDTDDAVSGPGSRRIITLPLPARDRTVAGVEQLVVHPLAGAEAPATAANASAVSWTVRGGTRHWRAIDGLSVRTRDGKPLPLREPGAHRLVLSLGGSNANPRVLVRRYGRGDDSRA
jgi:hypothetical protein